MRKSGTAYANFHIKNQLTVAERKIERLELERLDLLDQIEVLKDEIKQLEQERLII